MPSLTSFHLFPQLPPEKRLEIFAWTRYHHLPRIIKYDHFTASRHPISETLTDSYVNNRKYLQSPASRRLPPCFHVCSEAREECRKTFTWLKNGVWFDYSRDLLFMNDFSHDEEEEGKHKFPFLGPFVGEGELDVGKLRRVVMTKKSVMKHIISPNGNGWRHFFEVSMKKLEEFTIVECENRGRGRLKVYGLNGLRIVQVVPNLGKRSDMEEVGLIRSLKVEWRKGSHLLCHCYVLDRVSPKQISYLDNSMFANMRIWKTRDTRAISNIRDGSSQPRYQ